LGAVIAAKITPLFLISEVVRRLSRNTFLVLALIIPVIAGLGLNFAIVLGAMAAQAALFFVVDWNITGVKGVLLAMVIARLMSIFLGWLVGITLNRAKGRWFTHTIFKHRYTLTTRCWFEEHRRPLWDSCWSVE